MTQIYSSKPLQSLITVLDSTLDMHSYCMTHGRLGDILLSCSYIYLPQSATTSRLGTKENVFVTFLTYLGCHVSGPFLENAKHISPQPDLWPSQQSSHAGGKGLVSFSEGKMYSWYQPSRDIEAALKPSLGLGGKERRKEVVVFSIQRISCFFFFSASLQSICLCQVTSVNKLI